MEIPEDEKYDDHRITRETARKEYDAREQQEHSMNLFPNLWTKMQGRIGPMALSLAKHGGSVAQPEKAGAAVKSLILAYKQNQQQHPIPHTHTETIWDYVPDEKSSLNAFEESHTEGNEYYYYVINWRRCQFLNTRTRVYYGNCPNCYQAYPLGDKCTEGCTNQFAKVIYFRPPGPRVFEPAIPHELAKVTGNKPRFVIDEYELFQDNKERQKTHLQLPLTNVGCEIHHIHQFLMKTCEEFRDKPNFEAETCCVTKATQELIRTAVNAMIYDRGGRLERGEDLLEEDFTDEQVDMILTEHNHEYVDEWE